MTEKDVLVPMPLALHRAIKLRAVEQSTTMRQLIVDTLLEKFGVASETSVEPLSPSSDERLIKRLRDNGGFLARRHLLRQLSLSAEELNSAVARLKLMEVTVEGGRERRVCIPPKWRQP